MFEYLKELLNDLDTNKIEIKEIKQKKFALETAIDILLKLRNEKG